MQQMADGLRTPLLGLDPTGSQPTLAPTMQDLQTPADGGVVAPGSVPEPVDADQGSRPEESDEQRGDMPKQSSRQSPHEPAVPGLEKKAWLFMNAERMRHLANTHQPETKVEPRQSAEDDEGVEIPEAVQQGKAIGLYGGPRHIGMRRHLTEAEINMELQI
jgi:hypothetical protein